MKKTKWLKADFIDAVRKETGLDKTVIRTVFDRIFAGMKKALVEGRTIELRSIGTFKVVVRKGRKRARNPRTGEECYVDDHRVVNFRAGRELKNAVWDIPPETGSQVEDAPQNP